MHGMLRDGITTWFPSYINGNFNVPTKYSILVTSCVPVLAIFSIAFTRRFSKHFKNELHTSARLWGIALISCIGLLAFFSMRLFIAAVFMAIVIGCMHGINLMLISVFPSRFDKYGRISLFSGLLNACTYIGSSISTYVIAVITEKSGWLATIGVWTAVAAVGLILSVVSIKKTKNLMR
jgi:MFS transporter, OPA family, glycerol-3-phosphate transporter